MQDSRFGRVSAPWNNGSTNSASASHTRSQLLDSRYTKALEIKLLVTVTLGSLNASWLDSFGKAI